MSEKLAIMMRMTEAWKHGDIEETLAWLTDDVEYCWHAGSRPLVGKEQTRRFLEDFNGNYEQNDWRVVNLAEQDDLLMIEAYQELYDTKHERIIQQPFMRSVEFREGLIAKLRDYYEPAILDSATKTEVTSASGK